MGCSISILQFFQYILLSTSVAICGNNNILCAISPEIKMAFSLRKQTEHDIKEAD